MLKKNKQFRSHNISEHKCSTHLKDNNSVNHKKSQFKEVLEKIPTINHIIRTSQVNQRYITLLQYQQGKATEGEPKAKKKMNVADYLAIQKYNLGVKPDPNNKIMLPLYHSCKNKTYGN